MGRRQDYADAKEPEGANTWNMSNMKANTFGCQIRLCSQSSGVDAISG